MSRYCWVPELVVDPTYRHMSAQARIAFVLSLLLAQGYGASGALVRRAGPMTVPLTVGDIAAWCGLAESEMQRALDECLAVEYMARRDDGAYVVTRFVAPSAGKKPVSGSAERTRRYRERRAKSVTGDASQVPSRNAVTEHRARAAAARLSTESLSDERSPSAGSPPVTRHGDGIGDASPTGVTDVPSRAEFSAAAEFARWFITAAVKAGVMPEDRSADMNWAMLQENLDDARLLVETYGREECERRAQRFFAAKRAKKIRRPTAISALRGCWSFDELASDLGEKPAEADAELTPAGKRLMARFPERV